MPGETPEQPTVERAAEEGQAKSRAVKDTEPRDPFRVPGHPEARVPGRIGPQTPDRVIANRECRDC
jgi:hypothetical protein